MKSNIDYDRLLTIFLSKDHLRPAMCQPNTVGDKTYSTDAKSLLVIPNELIKGSYPAHEKTPKFAPVLENIKSCSPLHFKDIDLFRALETYPKVHDKSYCEDCEGSGRCPHCHQQCQTCDGEGETEDLYLPMVYTSKASIQIDDQCFSPYQLGKIEQLLIESQIETFALVGKSNSSALFEVGEMKVLIIRQFPDHEDERIPVTILNHKQ